ncbi:hypothetical protein BsWGS_00849 [Bradybaena similaris]
MLKQCIVDAVGGRVNAHSHSCPSSLSGYGPLTTARHIPLSWAILSRCIPSLWCRPLGHVARYFFGVPFSVFLGGGGRSFYIYKPAASQNINCCHMFEAGFGARDDDVCPSLPKKTTLLSVSPGMGSDLADQSNPNLKTSIAVRTGKCWLGM